MANSSMKAVVPRDAINKAANRTAKSLGYDGMKAEQMEVVTNILSIVMCSRCYRRVLAKVSPLHAYLLSLMSCCHWKSHRLLSQ